MPIEHPDLPYDIAALEPHMSANTLGFHHGKHHKGYVNKLNAAIEGSAYADQSLETIVRASHEASDTGVFNNAAQTFNHTFFWYSLSPAGGGEPGGSLADAIHSRFGSYADFRDAFKKAALGQFGSGWAWLVKTADGLDILKTGNAETPLTSDAIPLLTLDVWEHAYYLDYQNQRAAYTDAFLDHLVNWAFAEQNFAASD